MTVYSTATGLPVEQKVTYTEGKYQTLTPEEKKRIEDVQLGKVEVPEYTSKEIVKITTPTPTKRRRSSSEKRRIAERIAEASRKVKEAAKAIIQRKAREKAEKLAKAKVAAEVIAATARKAKELAEQKARELVEKSKLAQIAKGIKLKIEQSRKEKQERIKREVEFEEEKAKREAYRAEVGAVTIKDVAKKLDMPEEKIIEAVEYLPPVEEKRPLYMDEWVPFTEKELERAEFEKILRMKGWGRRKIKEFIAWLPIIIPFERRMEEKEFEIRREEGKYVPITKEGELVAARLISPPEVPYYEAQAEVAYATDEIARELLNKYTTKRDEEMNNYTKRLEKDIQQGKISTPEANKQLQDYNQRYGELLDKEIEKEYTDKITKVIEEKQGIAEEDAKRETKKYRLNVSLANLPLTLVAGATIGAISVLAPPVGAAYAGIMTSKLLTHVPETLAYARAAPLATAVEFGGFIAGAGLGGGLVKGVKLKYIAKSDLKAAIAKLPKAKQAEFMKYWNEVQKLENQAWYVPTKNVDFTGMNRLPTKLHNPTKSYLKSKGDVLGGSMGMRTMMHGKAKPSLSRWAESDLDIYTKGNPISRATELADLYRSYGIERVSTVKGKVTISGAKVAEFHSLEMLYGNLRSVTPYYQSLKSNIRTTPEGIKVAPILEAQAKRKLIGSYLDSRYSKDFPDFLKIEEALIQEAGILKGLKLSKPKPLVEDIFKIKGKKVTPTKVEPFKAPKVIDPFKISKIKPKVKEYPYGLYPKAKTLPFLVPPYPGYKKAKGISPIIPYKVPTKVPTIKPIIPYKVTPTIPKVTPIIPYKVTPTIPKVTPIIPYKVTPTIPKVTPIIPYKVPTEVPTVKPIIPYKVPDRVPTIKPITPDKLSRPLKRLPLIIPVKPFKPTKAKKSRRRKAPSNKPMRKIKVIKKGKKYKGSIRRFGKWKPLIKGTRTQVTLKVKRKIQRELGASYRVRDLKKKKFIMLPITKQFRRSKSKKTPYVVVEKRKYRLDSPKEKGEIKYAKRAAAKKPTKKSQRRNIFFK